MRRRCGHRARATRLGTIVRRTQPRRAELAAEGRPRSIDTEAGVRRVTTGVSGHDGARGGGDLLEHPDTAGQGRRYSVPTVARVVRI